MAMDGERLAAIRQRVEAEQSVHQENALLRHANGLLRDANARHTCEIARLTLERRTLVWSLRHAAAGRILRSTTTLAVVAAVAFLAGVVAHDTVIPFLQEVLP